MVLLRQAWFRSEGYRKKIYSRTILVTMVPKEYRTDEGGWNKYGVAKAIYTANLYSYPLLQA